MLSGRESTERRRDRASINLCVGGGRASASVVLIEKRDFQISAAKLFYHTHNSLIVTAGM